MPDIFDQIHSGQSSQPPPSNGDIFDQIHAGGTQPDDQSVAGQARKRLAARGLTPEAVKAGQGVTPNDFSTMGELQNPANFPTTKEVLSSVGEHAVGAVKSLLPHVPTSAPDAALSMADPAGVLRSTIDAVGNIPDAYANERARGMNPAMAGGRAVTGAIVPGFSTANALSEPLESILANRPVRKDENLAAAGGVGDIGGTVALGAALSKLPSHPSGGGPTPALDALDKSVGVELGEPKSPPYDTTPHGDIVNRTIGQGAVNTKRGINVGKAFVDAGEEISPAEVKKNPRALIAHTNKVIALENTAADQLLKSPEAQAPIADGRVLVKGAGENVALIDAADARAAKAVRRYVDKRIGELSAKHGGNGMLSIADTDVLKRELQNRANYDKIFGNTAMSSAGNLRNQLLADYARSFDSVGDTLPGYRELNDRRASLIDFRDNTLHPIVDAKIDASSAKPSKLGAVVRLGSAAVRANAFDAIKAGGDLAASATPIADPVRIAKAINQQVRAAKAAGAESPTARILANAQTSEPPATPPPTEIRPSAQFAASDRGEVFPIDRRPGAVASSFQPSGPTSAATPIEPPSVRSAARSAAQATQAQSNPGFDPERLPVKSSGVPPASAPVSPIDLANTLRGVSSAPGELYPSFLGSTRSSAPGQLGSGLADTVRGGTTPPGNVFPKRAGVEFPVTGDRDENDALFMRRTDTAGKPLKFPVPVPPSQLLPPQFRNAQAVQWGAPLPGVLDPETRGLYGMPFTGKLSHGGTAPTVEGDTANSVLIARSGTDEPGTYAHEVNHAVYQRDLTPEQKRQFQTAVVNAVNTGAKDKAVIATIPKAVVTYANAYPNDHDRAFNEMFAELGAQYMLNPTAFRSAYPTWYGMFKQFYGGKEYVQPKKRSDAMAPGGIVSQLSLADTLRGASAG